MLLNDNEDWADTQIDMFTRYFIGKQVNLVFSNYYLVIRWQTWYHNVLNNYYFVIHMHSLCVYM